ncbi:NADPH2:quinone reductase [Chryseobacterium oleae]|uniref:NADPH2:quinone reductase n=1 Tax=Chryseobacterium oleae TaxID=491207 RepID=A0A1I4YS85_CHROL|nr:zinc-binding dehydrogenase [Chryseobacterium oleae]SFN40895.1 NADPH2:quinone reductase [Chryseobacterium oleae]
MRAAYYTKKGNDAAILHVGRVPEIDPGPDELQIEIYFSGINPGEISKGALRPGGYMPYPFIIPHSDGAGIVRKTGANVPESWLGKKVLCFGAQSYRAHGTAAQYCSIPISNVIEITDNTPMIQAAQMGIPAMTGYMAVHKAGNLSGKAILVQGGAGAVGQCAIQFAKRAGALVIATVTREEDIEKTKKAGASDVFVLHSGIISEIKQKYPNGLDHVAEVSFDRNILMDLELLKNRGSIATYSSGSGTSHSLKEFFIRD